jgi:hypothetical protein
MGEMSNAYKIFVGKPEDMRPLGRTRHQNDRIDFREIGWNLWTGVA